VEFDANNLLPCKEVEAVMSLRPIMRRKRLDLLNSQTANAVGVACGIFLLLVLGALAVVPSLHQRLHSDSGHRDHLCVVTEFATGQLSWEVAVLVMAVAGAVLVVDRIPLDTPLVSYLGFNSASPRAPPR
jgi:hypothetical protein